jgi:hypothetical protein
MDQVPKESQYEMQILGLPENLYICIFIRTQEKHAFDIMLLFYSEIL